MSNSAPAAIKSNIRSMIPDVPSNKTEAMMMKYLTIDNDTLTNMQTFDNVESMNKAIQAHKQTHNLNDTDRAILDAISRYACKYAGVSYLSKQKLAESAGFKSRRTAIRSCQRLEALSIIEQHETRRIKGDKRRSSNIIVIKPIESVKMKSESVTTQSHSKEAPYKTNSSNTYKETAKPKKQPIDIIKRGLRNAIPAPIYDALEPFFDGQALYDTYGILLRAKARINRSILLENYADDYIDAFMNVIRRYKAGYVRNLAGYLFAAWEGLSAEIDRQICRHDGGILTYNPY